MGIPKRPGIGFALACGLCIGTVHGQSGWSALDGPSPASMQTVTAIDNVLLASGPYFRVYRSSDPEGPWSESFLPDGTHPLFMQSVDSLVFATDGRYMFRSADRGLTWKPTIWETLIGGAPRRIFRSNGSLVLTTAEGFYMSSQDQGITWHPKDNGATGNVETDSRPAARLGDLRFQAVAKGLRLSSNGGRTWTDLPMQFPDSINALQSGGGLLSLLSGSGLYLSADSGLTWKRPGGLAENLPVTSLSQSGSRVYAATRKGLLLSKDGGAVWKAVQQGLPVLNILAMAADGGRLFAADSLGLHLYEGSGPGWKKLSAAPADIRQLAVCESLMLAATKNDRLWISRDAGASWKPTGDSLAVAPVLSLALGPDRGFVSKAGGLYRTSDGGTTWQPVLSQDLILSPIALAIGSAQLYAATGSKTYRSRDDGLHWSLLPVTSEWKQLHLAARGGELFAADRYGMHLSTDEGSTWTWGAPMSPFLGDAFFAYSGERVYIAGYGYGIQFLEKESTLLRSRVPSVSAVDGIRLEREGGSAMILFDLRGNGWVTWEIYSADGRRAAAYASRKLAPGSYAFPYSLPAGHAGLLYRAVIRREDIPLTPMVRMGRLAP